MISLDMKYTSLYWALRFIENELDTHTKKYDSGYEITIYAEKQYVDYGKKIRTERAACGDLTRHKDFVILECVDRLLKKNIAPERIIINRNAEKPDIIIDSKIAVLCERWGDDYNRMAKSLMPVNGYEYTSLYTSRLVSGLLEFKNIILFNGRRYNYGLFEYEANIDTLKPYAVKITKIESVQNINDFDILENELIAYNGVSTIVNIPEGITAIGASAFWNNTAVEEIVLPQSLTRLGGDAFYYCTNLRKINIPKNVQIIGDNPFAGCPKLTEIINESPFFVMENGVLYDNAKKNLIHYTISKKDKWFDIPDSIVCLGKHCFFNCNNLEKITIPNSVIRFENNPFSGCENLTLENHSPYYIVEDGIIYNKFKTTIIGVLNNAKFDVFIVPMSVTLISRNSFWNCKKIKKIIITSGVKLIGYNPFASCDTLILESENKFFPICNGLMLNKDKTEIICCTNTVAKTGVTIPKGVKLINRGAFSGCKDLKTIDISGIEAIEKSAFTNCTSLSGIKIPDSVTYIGEWAFSYCTNLKKISIGRNTTIDRNAFNECPAKIEIRSE